jgi:integrase
LNRRPLPVNREIEYFSLSINSLLYRLKPSTPNARRFLHSTNGTRVPIGPGTAARELQTLRAMLYEAKRNQWIKQNPFEFARKNEVNKASDRKKRNLFLTFNQEIKLLRACETEDRRHLRALIIVAVDTCARFGELIYLKKDQLDFNGSGTIHGLLNYKDFGGDKQTRNAKMTSRVREALLDIIHNPPPKAFKVQRGRKPSADLVFGISNNVRTHGPEH